MKPSLWFQYHKWDRFCVGWDKFFRATAATFEIDSLFSPTSSEQDIRSSTSLHFTLTPRARSTTLYPPFRRAFCFSSLLPRLLFFLSLALLTDRCVLRENVVTTAYFDRHQLRQSRTPRMKLKGFEGGRRYAWISFRDSVSRWLEQEILRKRIRNVVKLFRIDP